MSDQNFLRTKFFFGPKFFVDSRKNFKPKYVSSLKLNLDVRFSSFLSRVYIECGPACLFTYINLIISVRPINIFDQHYHLHKLDLFNRPLHQFEYFDLLAYFVQLNDLIDWITLIKYRFLFTLI